jgi:hypothetical protein
VSSFWPAGDRRVRPCTHPNTLPAAIAGSCDHQQWLNGPFACDSVFLTENPKPRFAGCGWITASRPSDHQPLWLELR